MNRSAKTLLTAAAGTFLAWGGLNTSGYCFAERVYLSDERLIEPAVQHAYQSHLAHYRYRLGIGESGPLVKYASLEDFKKLNAGCCTLSAVANDGFSPSPVRRFLGTFRSFVNVKYFENESSVSQLNGSKRSIFFPVTNCGRITDVID